MKAAKVDVEPFWPGLFAKCCESVDIKELCSNVGSGAGAGKFSQNISITNWIESNLSFFIKAAPAAGAPAAGGAAPAEEKKEEKKEEPEEESDDDMGFGLFD